MKRFLLTALLIVTGLWFTIGYSQTYSDVNFYLAEGLELSKISEADSALIANSLREYHASEDDTSRINAIGKIVEGSWDDKVWPKYNQWVIDFTTERLADKHSVEITKHLKKAMAGAINNLGYLNKLRGDIPKALDYYHKSLSIQKEIGDIDGVATSLNNIGVIHQNQGDQETALTYYKEALQLRESMGHMSAVAMSLNNIANIYTSQKKYILSLESLNKTLEIQNELGDKKSVATALNNIGFIYNTQAKKKGISNSLKDSLLNKALVEYKKGLEIREEIEDVDGVVNSLNNIGTIELVLGNVQGALDYCTRSLTLAQELHYPHGIKNAANVLNMIFEKQKKGMQALSMHKLYILMRDSINNEKTQRATIKQQAEYEFEKEKELLIKENQIQELEIAKQQKGITILYGLIALVLLSSLLIVVYYRKNKLQHQYKLNLFHQQSLQAQVNPHFMFNVLNSIQTQILDGNLDNASLYLGNFASLMRKNLDSFSETLIPLSEEIQIITLYLKLEKIRFKEKLIYEIIIDPKIDLDGTVIIPMILQPVIENAILHGISPLETTGNVTINILKKNADTLEVLIADNGVGYKPSSANNSSKGLALTENRLNLWNKKNSFTIRNRDISEGGGTEAVFNIKIA
jgi:two-component system LytT family sensor kinase